METSLQKRYSKPTTLACILALAILLGTGCRKSSESSNASLDLTTEKDLSTADADVNSLLYDIDQAVTPFNLRAEAQPYFMATTPQDTTVGTFDSYMWITYSGIGDDDLSRSGGILLFLKKGHARSLGNYEDSAVCNNAVGGRTVQCVTQTKQLTADQSGTWKFQLTAKGKATNSLGRSMSFASSRTRVRSFANGSTPSPTDTWTISGDWNGRDGDGDSLQTEIVTSLVVNGSCSIRVPLSGVVVFYNLTAGVRRSIDFGSGACDHIAIFTSGLGKEFQIEIP